MRAVGRAGHRAISLRDGAAAHARLEDRAFSGKIVMTSEE